MRVFISYSGPRGTKIAESLKYALDGVFPNVDVFCASERLHGKRWREGLRDALAASDFGIAVLTPDSHSAPWILFESGALTKGLGEAFFPIRYGLEPKDLPRPLEEFHGLNGHDFDEIFEFVRDIHAALNQREPGSDNRSETRLREDFDRQWVDLQRHVDEALSLPLGSSTETRRGGSAAVLDRVRGYYVAAATDKDHNRAADRRRQIWHFNRSLAQLTGDDSPYGSFKCPELYYSEGGRWRTSRATPLLWTQANLVLALLTLEQTCDR